MKVVKINLALTLFLALLLPRTHFAATMFYAPATMELPPVQREFRAAWVATVGNIDWPSKPGLPVKQQKEELLRILDRAMQLNLNAIVLQVRPACDAMYASKIEPWSYYLTGAMGKAPQPWYDPLAFAVAEAHKRGLELHAWFNPYRVAMLSPPPAFSRNHITRTHPEWVQRYGSSLWLDPGEKAAAEYSLEVVMDVVRRYDIDGVQFDDYFYPYKEKDAQKRELEFPDGASWRKYGAGGGLSRDDWRRENVNSLVHQAYESIKAAKPWVKFGIAPFGIWEPGFPKQIRGKSAYTEIYTDSRRWLTNGWVDYWSPQLYWAIDLPDQSFPVLLQWWTEQNPKHRNIWPGIFSEGVAGKTDVWTFATGEVHDAAALLKKVQIKADPVSAFIHESLPTDVKNSLAGYEYSKREPPGLLASVVRTLNGIVTGPSFYDTRRFEKIPLRPETIKIGESAPRGQELTRFNRMLLEDAYPLELAKTRKWRAEEILNQIKLTREICAPNTAGELYFSMKSLMQDRGGLVTDLAAGDYSEPALIPASPWLDANFPDKPSLKVAGTKKFTWSPAVTGTVSWWVLQTRTDGSWRTEILPGNVREISLTTWPDAVALTAIDRCGMASPANILRRETSPAR